MFGHDRDELTFGASGNPGGMAVWIDVKPPHQAVLRAHGAWRHGLLDPSRGEDLLAVPDAATEIQLTELEHVRRTQPQQTARGVQAGRISAPVETGATFGFTMPALAADHPGLQTPVALLHFLGAACFGLFLYVFPDGRFVPRWTRWMAPSSGSAGSWPSTSFPAWTTDPAAWQLVIESLVWLGALGTVIYSQIHRYRHVPSPRAAAADQVGGVRHLGGVRRISWASMLALSALDASPEPATPRSVLAYLIGYTLASYLVMLLVPVTIGIAMLRHHLFDIDLVINRTLVYGTLTACVVAIYVLRRRLPGHGRADPRELRRLAAWPLG